MSQRRPGAAASALSVASSAAVENQKCFSPGRRLHRLAELPAGAFDDATAAGGGVFGALDVGRRRAGFSFRRRSEDDSGRQVAPPLRRPMFPRGRHVGNQSFHISSIHSQSDHAGSFHLGSGRFQNCRQLSGRILTGSMSQRRPSAATSRSLRGIHCSLENQKCSSPERSVVAPPAELPVGAFDGPAVAAGSALAGADDRRRGSRRSWRIARNPHFQVAYFGSVVNHIVARNTRYLIRLERTHNRGVSRIFVKAAHARMAVQALQVAVPAV